MRLARLSGPVLQDPCLGGPCDYPGVCCYQGNCLQGVTMLQCAQMGGAFRGQCLTCAGTGCLPAEDFIVGQGGAYPSPNQVRGFRTDGSLSADFLAYAAGHYGTNVASGALGGGGPDEIVTGPGPGPTLGPHVRGFNRYGAALSGVSFFAYGTLRYGVNVSAGDLDGSSIDEIITGAGPGPVFGPHVRGFDYGGSVVTPIPGLSFQAYATLRYGVNVTVIQADVDTVYELATGPGPGPVFGPNVRGWDYDNGVAAGIPWLVFNAFAVPQFGVQVGGGDYGVVVCAPGSGPGPTFPAEARGFSWSATTVSPTPGFDVVAYPTSYGARVDIGNVNGRPSIDLLVAPGPDPAAMSVVAAYHYDYNYQQLFVNEGPFTAFAGAMYGDNVVAGGMGY
ncbi:MAG: hypothetical protein U0166_22705 [Acidobacteriota bacterium]